VQEVWEADLLLARVAAGVEQLSNLLLADFGAELLLEHKPELAGVDGARVVHIKRVERLLKLLTLGVAKCVILI
jgi:hypothetical protein